MCRARVRIRCATIGRRGSTAVRHRAGQTEFLRRPLRSDGQRGRRAQEEIRADTPFVGLIFLPPFRHSCLTVSQAGRIRGRGGVIRISLKA